jgi:hypothetical protein
MVVLLSHSHCHPSRQVYYFASSPYLYPCPVVGFLLLLLLLLGIAVIAIAVAIARRAAIFLRPLRLCALRFCGCRIVV